MGTALSDRLPRSPAPSPPLPRTPALRPRLPRYASALGSGLGGRTTGSGQAHDPHRLETERELLPPVARGDIEPGQLTNPLKPVADRVAMGEEPRRGRVDVG